MGGRYQVAKEGNWKYRIIDTESRIKLGFGEVGQEVMLVTYSKVVADICEAALNANKVKWCYCSTFQRGVYKECPVRKSGRCFADKPCKIARAE